VTYPVRPITVSARVPGDPDRAFSFVSDTRNDPLWCPNVTNVEQTSGDGVEVGATFRFHQSLEARGRSLESDVEVEIVELGDRWIVWRVEDRFQVREIRLEVSAADRGSNVSQTTRAAFKRAPGITKWLYPMLARRTFRDQFRDLAEHFS